MPNANQSQSLVAVEDDPGILREIARSLENRFNVLATSDWAQALAWLQKDAKVKLLMVGQALRAGPGINLLESAMQIRPDVRRILITKYAELSSLIQGLHDGTIHRTVGTATLHKELATLTAENPSPLPAGAAHS
jgi:ActR/RegA family two-component response regulator